MRVLCLYQDGIRHRKVPAKQVVMEDEMIEFKVEVEKYPVENAEPEMTVRYPCLFVGGIKDECKLPIDEWAEVVAMVRKKSASVNEDGKGKTYSYEYEVKGFHPMKSDGVSFGEKLDKLMEG